MARQVKVEMIDDVDGIIIEDGKGETVAFALDGVTYEIDLTDKNAKKLRDALAPFTNVARKTTTNGARGKGTGATTRRDPAQTKAIKEWLHANGYTPPARGRIPQEMLNAYEAANA